MSFKTMNQKILYRIVWTEKEKQRIYNAINVLKISFIAVQKKKL